MYFCLAPPIHVLVFHWQQEFINLAFLRLGKAQNPAVASKPVLRHTNPLPHLGSSWKEETQH